MRGFFNTALKTAGCDSFHIEFWMGHKLDGSKASYFLGNPEGEKELYSRYVPFLTIQKEEDITANPIFQERESYRQALEAQLAKTTIDNSELQDLREEVKTLKEFKEMFDKIEMLDDERQRELKTQFKWIIGHLSEQSKY
jgi:hypothetical protein